MIDYAEQVDAVGANSVEADQLLLTRAPWRVNEVGEKVFALPGPVSQYEYGSVTRCENQSHQVGLIHSPKTGTLVVDVDGEDFDQTDLAEYLTWHKPFCTRGAWAGLPNRHFLVDARRIAASGRWVPQGPIVGGDIKSNGFTPFPGSVHPSGDRYEVVVGEDDAVCIVPCTEELFGLLVAARANAPKVASRTGGSGSVGALEPTAVYVQNGLPDGAHDSVLTALAARFAGAGMSDDKALELLKAIIGRTTIDDRRGGWPDENLLRKIASGREFCARQNAQVSALIKQFTRPAQLAPAGAAREDAAEQARVDELGTTVADQGVAQEPTGAEASAADAEAPEYAAIRRFMGMRERARREIRRELDAQEAAAARGPRVKRTAAAYARLPQIPAIVENVLAAEVNLLAGPSAAGKSLLARDWALHVAAGEPWRRHRVPEARTVLMILSEGVHDVAQRWASQPLWEAAKDHVFILDEPVSLLSSADLAWLMEEYAEERPGLVVFDLIYAAGLTDDNTSKDVQPLISALKKISAHWQAATLAVGHNGHNGERRFRGSSAWRQQAATEWHLGDDQLTCEKSKITDARQLAVPCTAKYPDLVWPGTTEVIFEEARRRVLIEQDIRARPEESDSARARRLGPLCGLHSAAMRKRIADVAKMIKEMDA